MATKKKKTTKATELVRETGSPTVTMEVIPPESPIEEKRPFTIGQQVRVTGEVKHGSVVMRPGTPTVIEGMAGDKYKILYRGFRFWVPAEIVEQI